MPPKVSASTCDESGRLDVHGPVPAPPPEERDEEGSLPSPQERRLVGTVVLLLYLAACFSPFCFIHDTEGSHPWLGLAALLFGWLLWLPWSANLFLLLGWLRYRRGRAKAAWRFGIQAVLVGGTTVALPLCASSWFERLMIGYYLWQGSLVVFAVAAFRLDQAQRIGRLSRFPAPSEG